MQTYSRREKVNRVDMHQKEDKSDINSVRNTVVEGLIRSKIF